MLRNECTIAFNISYKILMLMGPLFTISLWFSYFIWWFNRLWIRADLMQWNICSSGLACEVLGALRAWLLPWRRCFITGLDHIFSANKMSTSKQPNSRDHQGFHKSKSTDLMLFWFMSLFLDDLNICTNGPTFWHKKMGVQIIVRLSRLCCLKAWFFIKNYQREQWEMHCIKYTLTTRVANVNN